MPAAPWTGVKDGVMLAPGGEVKTWPDSSVVLAFSDGNKVKLEERTTFGVEGATTLRTSLRLFSGKLAAWVKRGNKADFRVRHAAGVAAVRGTVFTMIGTETGLRIALFEGSLEIVDIGTLTLETRAPPAAGPRPVEPSCGLRTLPRGLSPCRGRCRCRRGDRIPPAARARSSVHPD
jgi:ferric-dicitrate binding protein FerR (iron transport regulator)